MLKDWATIKSWNRSSLVNVYFCLVSLHKFKVTDLNIHEDKNQWYICSSDGEKVKTDIVRLYNS